MVTTSYDHYPPEVLAERARSLVSPSEYELPVVTGVMVDGVYTASHEQGLSINSDTSAVLHIVDTTVFEAGGPIDQHALLRRRSTYDSAGRVTARMIPDPITYRRLNLKNPEGTPVISFAFEKTDEHWKLAGVSESLFVPLEIQRLGTNEHADELEKLEKELKDSLSTWMGVQDDSFGIGFIKNEYDGRIRTTSPLRHWADFRNLRIVRDVFIENRLPVLLSTDRIGQITKHLSGISTFSSLEESRDTLESDMALDAEMLGILSVADITKYRLKRDTFERLCDGLWEDAGIDVVRVAKLSRLLGYKAGAFLPEKPNELRQSLITLLLSAERNNAEEIAKIKAKQALEGLREEAQIRREILDDPTDRILLQGVNRVVSIIRSRR